uniref:Uncharacterized protein n=1 Tax=Chrysotila carterae TaxID=13221 RepID=A0A7S4F5L0_CHRCT
MLIATRSWRRSRSTRLGRRVRVAPQRRRTAATAPTTTSGPAAAMRGHIEALRDGATSLICTADDIGLDGIAALAEVLMTNSGLKNLSLRDAKLSESDAKALADVLKRNTSLNTLDLSNNAFGEDVIIALAEAVKVNTSLTTLYLSGDSCGQKGAIALVEALNVNAKLTTLELPDGVDEELKAQIDDCLARNGKAS